MAASVCDKEIFTGAGWIGQAPASRASMNSKLSKPKTLVMKFGGTSVGSAEALAKVIGIIESNKQDWPQTVVVVSALSGATNLLIDSALQAAEGRQDAYLKADTALRSRHNSMARAFIPAGNRQDRLKMQTDGLIDEFSRLCQAITVLGEATPRALDAIASLGERLSARLLSASLQERGFKAETVDAFELIVTDAQYQSAAPDFSASSTKTRNRLNPLFAKDCTPITTGFIGATPEGIPTTLGRGGSDYSAAILGTILDADEVWIWTDVDGVMTADPRFIPEAHTLAELTFREVAELAYFGAKVLHPKTIRPVIDKGIGLRVCNTFTPERPGTYLIRERKSNDTGVIRAITEIRGIQLITVEGRGMMGIVGVAARTFKAVAETGTNVHLISQASSEQSICFAVPQEASSKVCTALKQEFSTEIARKDIDSVWNTQELVIVTVVGEGMRNTPGVSGRIFSALGNKRVNVIAIAQGSSEVSISLVLDARDTEIAMRALHELI
jgi:bifunctional aspartokinase / homoserine dehydrogenase 1